MRVDKFMDDFLSPHLELIDKFEPRGEIGLNKIDLLLGQRRNTFDLKAKSKHHPCKGSM